MSMRIIEPLFSEKQLRQAVIVPKQVNMPIEGGRDPDGRLEVFDRLLRLALGVIQYPTKDLVTGADRILESVAFAREEVNRSKYGFFCGVRLPVPI